jgi:hypothetical protein
MHSIRISKHSKIDNIQNRAIFTVSRVFKKQIQDTKTILQTQYNKKEHCKQKASNLFIFYQLTSDSTSNNEKIITHNTINQ